jgi:hypothetical protein
MEPGLMARVKVTHDHIVEATPSVNLLYRAGSEVTAPRAHIESIVSAGHGERVPARRRAPKTTEKGEEKKP